MGNNEKYKSFFNNIDKDIYVTVLEYEKQVYQNGYYLEAFVIRSCMVELLARGIIVVQLKNHGMRTHKAKMIWDNIKTRFDQIILVCEALDANEKIISKLREFQKVRNDLIHNCLMKTVDQIKGEAQQGRKLGMEISELIVKIYSKPSLTNQQNA